MKLLEKYYMVKLDNYRNEGFKTETIMIMQEYNISGALSREEVKDFDGNIDLIIKQNKLYQEYCLELIEKQLNERGRCDKCNGWLTSQYFEKRLGKIKTGGKKGGSSKSEKKVNASKANAAKLNASMTPEKRAEIQKKRIATMAKKREERERLKRKINN